MRSRPPAILVHVSKEDFPALSKKIRGEINHEVTGNHIVGVRQAKSGRLLIQVRGDPSQVEAVRAEVARTAGLEIGVKTLQKRTTFEIRDLDEWSNHNEIISAVAAGSGADCAMVRVVSLRKQFGGVQVVLVSAPEDLSKMITEAQRLRVGIVNCRVRPYEERTRCFRCMSYGHIARACKGPDRSGSCRRYGAADHKAQSCDSSLETQGLSRRSSEAEKRGQIATPRSMKKEPRARPQTT